MKRTLVTLGIGTVLGMFIEVIVFDFIYEKEGEKGLADLLKVKKKISSFFVEEES